MKTWVLSFAVLVASACDSSLNAGNSCNATTCEGCCTPEGACRTGNVTSACGANGVACIDCSVQNATCSSAGTCLPGSGGGGDGGGDAGNPDAGGGGGGDGGGTVVFDGGWATLENGWQLAERPSIATGFLDRVHGTGPDDVWAVGEGNPGMHWNGASWEAVPRLATFPGVVTGVFARARYDVWICGYSDTAMRFDGGWAPVPLPGGCYAVIAISANDAWAFHGSAAKHWDGTSWTASRNGLDSATSVNAAWALSGSNVWAVGEKGLVARWDGGAWSSTRFDAGVPTSYPPEPPPQFNGVWGSAADDVWVVGSTLLRWDGQRLAPMPLGTDAGTLLGVHGTSRNDVWVAARDGALHWNGTGWQMVPWPGGGTAPVASVWTDTAGTAWFADGHRVLRRGP